MSIFAGSWAMSGCWDAQGCGALACVGMGPGGVGALAVPRLAVSREQNRAGAPTYVWAPRLMKSSARSFRCTTLPTKRCMVA